MDERNFQSILTRVEEYGRIRAKPDMIIDYLHQVQRDYADDAKLHDFKYDLSLYKAKVSVREMLALLGGDDDKYAVEIFEQYEKEQEKEAENEV